MTDLFLKDLVTSWIDQENSDEFCDYRAVYWWQGKYIYCRKRLLARLIKKKDGVIMIRSDQSGEFTHEEIDFKRRIREIGRQKGLFIKNIG